MIIIPRPETSSIHQLCDTTTPSSGASPLSPPEPSSHHPSLLFHHFSVDFPERERERERERDIAQLTQVLLIHPSLQQSINQSFRFKKKTEYASRETNRSAILAVVPPLSLPHVRPLPEGRRGPQKPAIPPSMEESPAPFSCPREDRQGAGGTSVFRYARKAIKKKKE